MTPLPILWQRLVSEGKTCVRCGATYQEMQRAIEKLNRSIRWALSHVSRFER